MNECHASEYKVFDSLVIVFDLRSLQSHHSEDTLGKVARYIKERGGFVMMAMLTNQDSGEIEILPSPKKGMTCTHIIAEDGANDAGWWGSFLDCGLGMDGVEVVNLVWVFACLQAHRLLPSKSSLFTTDRMRKVPENCTKNVQKTRMIYTDDTMDVGMSVSCSGFKKMARTLVEVMAGSMSLTFHKAMHVSGMIKTDALIVLDTQDTSSEKMRAAKDASIPVVNFKWLLDSYREWTLLPFSGDNHQTGSEKDLDDLILSMEGCGEELGSDGVLVPDSVDESSSESIEPERDCSPTPPLENVTISGGNLLALAPEEDNCIYGSGAVHPISQDLSSTSNTCNGDAAGPREGSDSDRQEKENQRGDHAKNSAENYSRDEDRDRSGGGPSSSGGGTAGKHDHHHKWNHDGVQPVVETKRRRPSEITKDELMHQETKTKYQKLLKSSHITMSGMHSTEQKACLPLLRALHVPYTTGTHSWNPKFTHVITHSLRRNQKCLSALACGAWIVHPSFLKASLALGRLAPEVCMFISLSFHHSCLKRHGCVFPLQESYEIKSGDESSGIDPNMPHFWRTTIANSGTRAFEGLVCSLYRITSSSTPSKEDIRYVKSFP